VSPDRIPLLDHARRAGATSCELRFAARGRSEVASAFLKQSSSLSPRNKNKKCDAKIETKSTTMGVLKTSSAVTPDRARIYIGGRCLQLADYYCYYSAYILRAPPPLLVRFIVGRRQQQ
jgi:hypothetical protein